MSKLVYDISIVAGLLLIACGVWAKWDVAAASIVAGTLVILLTYAAIWLTDKR